MGFELLEDREVYQPRPDDQFPRIHPYRKADELQGGKMATLEVKEAGKAGKGIFARVQIPEGREVFVFDGEKSTQRLQSNFWETGGNPNAIVVGREFMNEHPSYGEFVWANPGDNSPLRSLNHSCEPNIGRSADDSFQFVASRDIEPGEQLVADYSLIETDPEWSVHCACGAKRCRKHVGGITSLPAKQLAESWDNIPRFMQEYALQTSEDPRIKDLVKKNGVVKITAHFPELIKKKKS